MNLPLLCVVLPLAALLFFQAVMWILSNRDEERRKISWGGFHSKERATAWCLTYMLSSLGGLLTFYLFVVYTNDNAIPVLIFAALNVSFIVYLYVVDEGYDKKDLVRSCLMLNVILYILLFAYTVVAFPLDHKDVSNAPLLVVTHFCNAVAIFHALFMDAYVWFEGWADKVDHVWKEEMRGDESIQ